MNNSTLSAEQRKKIEENRKRALEIKAKKFCLPPTPNQNVPQNETKQAQTQFHLNNKHDRRPVQKPFHPNHRGPFNSEGEKASSSSCQSFVTKAKTFSGGAKTNKQSSSVEVSKEKFYGMPQNAIKGKCVLISAQRFCVQVGYHGALIECFKQMETRNYDTASRTWSFHLTEYEKFYKEVGCFKPEVVIEPLPAIIKQTFCVDATELPVSEVSLSSVDKKLVKTLMPFQKEGVFFAIHRVGRILLADDMGLGKTLQALCIARYYKSEWPLLIVTPSSVRFDWAQQIYKWLPSVSPQEVSVLDSGKGSVKDGLVIIISYDLMPKKVEDLKKRQFKVVIMDESHCLKNPKAIRTKAAAVISKLSKRIILLSGTPALSRPSELFTQISAVCPSMCKFHDFGLRYCAAKELPWGWDYSGSANLEELQLLLERKIMIRRQKSDVLDQLPEKTRQVIVLNPALIAFSKDLSRAFKIVDKTSLKGPTGRGALLQYFHETSKAKLKAVRDFILDLIEAEKKFLVFAHHREMLDCIEDAIVQHGKIKYMRIDGKTKSEQRSLLSKKFQTDEEMKVAVLSITAANAGLNLSAANLVVFAELFWNPGILVQAEDRVHRIGQKRSVSIQYLLASKTADDFVWPLVQDKLNILTKAGLSKDCFSDADTQHVVKPQKSIMEMFKQNFIEEDSQCLSNSICVAEKSEQGPSASNELDVTPIKRKRHRSSSISPSSKQDTISGSPNTPRKRQLLITNFVPSCEEGGSNAGKKTKQTCDSGSGESSKDVIEIDSTSEPDMNNYNVNDQQSDHVKVCQQGNGASGNVSTEYTVLSAEDFQALDGMGWDQDFWD